MRRIVAALTAAVALTAAGTFASGTASALGGETFGCRISPSPTAPPYTTTCRNRQNSSTYLAAFLVDNVTAPSTYSWSVPTAYQGAIVDGCTSDRSDCGIALPNKDAYFAVSVTITQNGVSETLTAYASMSRYCGSLPC